MPISVWQSLVPLRNIILDTNCIPDVDVIPVNPDIISDWPYSLFTYDSYHRYLQSTDILSAPLVHLVGHLLRNLNLMSQAFVALSNRHALTSSSNALWNTVQQYLLFSVTQSSVPLKHCKMLRAFFSMTKPSKFNRDDSSNRHYSRRCEVLRKHGLLLSYYNEARR